MDNSLTKGYSVSSKYCQRERERACTARTEQESLLYYSNHGFPHGNYVPTSLNCISQIKAYAYRGPDQDPFIGLKEKGADHRKALFT